MKILTLIFFICFLMLVSCQNDTEKTASPQSIEELQSQLYKVLKENHVPGMSLAIVDRNGPILVAGLGIADLKTERKVTPSTLFRMGSISKGFVSLAIVDLVSKGKLSLDDPIKEIAPEIKFDNPWEDSDPIRVVHLLENTTGWDDMHLREFAKDPENLSLLSALNFDPSSRTSRWRPGTRMSYCNSGPAVAAYIVEKLTGKNFEDSVKQNFFDPLGMKTATYYQPTSELATTLYQSNGKTTQPYWNLLYRPIGAINASAEDMANYLLFYLNPNFIKFARLESLTTTWAAKEGLHVGYGLGNFTTIFDGFIYHGHDGNIPDGLSIMQYLPDEGLGYFYSINSENRDALKKIGALIRAFITKDLPKSPVSNEVALSENSSSYAGWYEPNSPRVKLFYGLEKLFGLTYIHFNDNKLISRSLAEGGATYLPVSPSEFRYVSKTDAADPVPTLKLLEPKDEELFIQVSYGLRNPALIHSTLKQIPTWLAILEITLTLFVMLSLLISFIYIPFWLCSFFSKNSADKKNLKLFLWPFIALSSLLSMVIIGLISAEEFIPRFGQLTIWSFSLFIASIALASSSIMSAITLLQHNKRHQGYGAVTTALMITTAYLSYWNIIGLRSWT